MFRISPSRLRLAPLLAVFTCLLCLDASADRETRVLILSGANNHDWRKTTPAIKAALEESGRFAVDVEEDVLTMKPGSFAPYDVILSDFNTFGRHAPERKEWDADTRRAFLAHMANPAWRTLLQRGTEWAATGKVTIPPAADWPATKADAGRMTP